MNKTKQKKSLKYLEFIMFVFPWSKKTIQTRHCQKQTKNQEKLKEIHK